MTERKSSTSTRKTAAKKTTAKKPATQKKASTTATPKEKQESTVEKIVREAQDKVDAYNALKEQGLPIPADLKAEVEGAQKEEPPENKQRFVRNLSNSPFRMKFDRHTSGQPGIRLQARGTRGDLSPIEPEDLKDPHLVGNISAGFVEVITYAEAADVVSKQTTNQQAQHPALSALRNEKGQAYGENALQVASRPDENAVTVATLQDGQIVVDRNQIQGRVRGEAPGTPEYVGGAEPQHRPANEDPAYLSDIKARQRGANPTDGLQVSVEPTQRATTGGNPSIISDGFNPDNK